MPTKAEIAAEMRRRGIAVPGESGPAPAAAAAAPSSPSKPSKADIAAEMKRRGLAVPGEAQTAEASGVPPGVQPASATPAPAEEDDSSLWDYVPGASQVMDVYDLATQGLTPEGNVPESVRKRHERFGAGTSAAAEAASVMAGGAGAAAKLGGGILKRALGSGIGSGGGSAAAQLAQEGEVDPTKTATEAAFGAVGQGVGDALTGGAKLFGGVTSRIFGGEGLETAAETAARKAGAPSAGPPGDTSPPASGAPPANKYRDMVKTLKDEGVGLTAGQESGSKFLRQREETRASTLFGGKTGETMESQAKQAQSALMKRAGFEADDVAAGVVDDAAIDRAKDSFRRRYGEVLAGKEIDLARDSTIDRIGQIEADHADLVDFEQAPMLRRIIDDFTDRATKGPITGEAYQRLRSNLGKKAKAKQLNDPTISGLYKQLQTTLDDAFLEAADASTSRSLKEINKDYRNFNVFKKVAKQGGQGVSSGQMPFASLARAAHDAGTRDFKKVARAASGVFSSGVPNSGTVTRLLGSGIFDATKALPDIGVEYAVRAGQKIGLGRGPRPGAGILRQGLTRGAAYGAAQGQDERPPPRGPRILSERLIRDQDGRVIGVDL